MFTTKVIPIRAGHLAIRTAGEGPLILLLHGIPGSSAVWERVQIGLAEHGFRSWAPDLLGFGDSSRPTDPEALWLESQAQAVAEALVSADASPVVVLAHDYGVPVSITLAQRAPDRVPARVLAAGNVFTDTPIPVPLRVLEVSGIGRAFARVALSGPALGMMLRQGSGTPRPAFDRGAYLGDRRQQQAIREIFTMALRDLEVRYAPVERMLPQLYIPTTVLWGDRDPFFPVQEAERVVAAIPGATLELLKGAGHFLPAERPDAFVRAVTRLASRHQHGVATVSFTRHSPLPSPSPALPAAN